MSAPARLIIGYLHERGAYAERCLIIYEPTPNWEKKLYYISLQMKGDFGESLANILLGQNTPQGQLFETIAIGGKWPTIDIYAETSAANGGKIFCFFQVKSTVAGYTTKGHLKVKAKREHLDRLAKFNAPTYLIGVDLDQNNPPKSQGFIKTIRGNQPIGISSMDVTSPINAANLILLKTEVVAFWAALNPLNQKNIYQTNF